MAVSRDYSSATPLSIHSIHFLGLHKKVHPKVPAFSRLSRLFVQPVSSEASYDCSSATDCVRKTTTTTTKDVTLKKKGGMGM